MIEQANVKKILYGGDYNPEQWPEEIWEEDMRIFKIAGIDVVTLNVFNWAMLQPNETTYQFEKLDKVMEMVYQNQLKVCLATSTAAHPAWMAKQYPEILRTEFSGMKRKFGSRHNSCPNSPIYRKYSSLLAKNIAERYGHYDNLVAWHVSNEYGGECYCENCEKAFRFFLKERYGSIEELNKAWNTSFWSHTFYDFDEIVAPNLLSEHFEENRTTFQGISLDYKKFMSQSMQECYKLEADILRSITPNIPITTNLMGFYKTLDYHKWAEDMDFISWDNYPSNDESFSCTAMKHELMRGLKQGKPFALMEQTPSVTNWLPYNALKRPGIMRLWSYQAVAHGADTIMFFQMRRSIGACEKYHGAVIDHVGSEHTRVFRELTALGNELKVLGDKTLGGRHRSKVALFFDWENWWAIEFSAGPSVNLKYFDQLLFYYEALNTLHYSVDIIGCKDELSNYDVVIAPVLYMVKDGLDEKIRAFVSEGGTFVTTFFSGYVNETDLVTLGGYPGKLRDILGIWVEELDALPAGNENSFVYKNTTYPSQLICDLLHPEQAEVLSVYEQDFYAGMPTLTKNSFGKGKAYYVATQSDASFYRTFLTDLLNEKNILPVVDAPLGVEATKRYNQNGCFLFLLNHNNEDCLIPMREKGIDLLTGETLEKDSSLLLKSKDVKIIHVQGDFS